MTCPAPLARKRSLRSARVDCFSQRRVAGRTIPRKRTLRVRRASCCHTRIALRPSSPTTRALILPRRPSLAVAKWKSATGSFFAADPVADDEPPLLPGLRGALTVGVLAGGSAPPPPPP